MGLLDNLLNTLHGSGTHALTIELLPDEREVFRTPGAAQTGGLSVCGGDIVVTNQRLLFTPLNVADISALLAAGLKRAGAPKSATAMVGWIAKVAANTASATFVTACGPGRGGTLFMAPTIIATTTEDRTIELSVLAHRRSPNGAQANVDARDRLVAAINANASRPAQSGRTTATHLGGAPALGPAPAFRRVASPLRTTAALTEAEIEAASIWPADDAHDFTIYLPMARAPSSRASLDPRFVGTWRLDDLGGITLAADGSLSGRAQLFGAAPPGTLEGEWWIDGTPAALVLNFTSVQYLEAQTITFSTSWPLQLIEIGERRVLASMDDETNFTLIRVA